MSPVMERVPLLKTYGNSAGPDLGKFPVSIVNAKHSAVA